MTKFKKVTITSSESNRTPAELLREVKDRLKYRYRHIDGSYDLPFDDPFLYDVLVMILRQEHNND